MKESCFPPGIAITTARRRIPTATCSSKTWQEDKSEEDRVDHLVRFRELQDETHGFVTFIPLAFHPDNTPLQHIPKTDARRQAELEEIAEVCRRVPAHAPRDFREALQSYWFVHLAVVTELNTWDSFCPGHLDQHLCPF